MRRATLGIDLGTSSVKVVVFDVEADLIVGQADTSYDVLRPQPGWAETEPATWLSAIGDAASRALAGAGRPAISGIGFSGQMHGVVLCDDEGRPTRPAVLWADARAAAELEVYRALPHPIRARLANPLSPGMAGPILGWLAAHEAETVSRSRWALQPKDWVRARLTGAVAGEPSDASATLLYDVGAAAWDGDVAEALGIRTELLAPLLPWSGAVAGALTPEGAALLGLDAGVPVASGAADTAAALLGSGLTQTGAVQLTIGTGVQIVTPREGPVLGDVDPLTHCFRAATPTGWYGMAASITGGQSLDWVRRILDVTWDELYDAATHQPLSSDPVFLPHLIGERTPYFDTEMRGGWVGVSASHSRADLLYAALEGVAFATAESLAALPVTWEGNRGIRLAGGGTRVPAWRQLLADALTAPLYAVDVPGASGRGAALTGAYAAADGRIDALEVGMPTAELAAAPGPRASVLAARRERYHEMVAVLRHR